MESVTKRSLNISFDFHQTKSYVQKSINAISKVALFVLASAVLLVIYALGFLTVNSRTIRVIEPSTLSKVITLAFFIVSFILRTPISPLMYQKLLPNNSDTEGEPETEEKISETNI